MPGNETPDWVSRVTGLSQHRIGASPAGCHLRSQLTGTETPPHHRPVMLPLVTHGVMFPTQLCTSMALGVTGAPLGTAVTGTHTERRTAGYQLSEHKSWLQGKRAAWVPPCKPCVRHSGWGQSQCDITSCKHSQGGERYFCNENHEPLSPHIYHALQTQCCTETHIQIKTLT